MSPWLPRREKKSERRKKKSGKERQIDRVRFSKERNYLRGKTQNQAYLTVPSSEGHALVMGRSNSHCVCVCVCELPLPGNKSRVIGVARPPEGKARVITEGGREGQNEKEEEEEEGNVR